MYQERNDFTVNCKAQKNASRLFLRNGLIGRLAGIIPCILGALLGDFTDMKALADGPELLAKASVCLADGDTSLNHQRC
ncbi:MAG: hypothetical protein IKH57_12285 [Clostridia bacterium]|nr:hypothetical protein [Clostridia bacterium]